MTIPCSYSIVSDKQKTCTNILHFYGHYKDDIKGIQGNVPPTWQDPEETAGYARRFVQHEQRIENLPDTPGYRREADMDRTETL